MMNWKRGTERGGAHGCEQLSGQRPGAPDQVDVILALDYQLISQGRSLLLDLVSLSVDWG